MKVVFLQDVPNVAKAGQVKQVSDGYGRNYLLPQKLAQLATKASLKEAEIRVRQEEQKREVQIAEMKKVAEELDGITVSFTKKVSTGNKLYGSIRDVHIAQAIHSQTGYDIDKGSIHLEHPIDSIGSHELTIKLGGDLKPKITVVVEEGDEQ
ncbi:MAG: 50S ribosomal protein L9 [Chloroflexota bacterium]|nr:50S ribosomal protein L9 [Chloroflexota bacterium]